MFFFLFILFSEIQTTLRYCELDDELAILQRSIDTTGSEVRGLTHLADDLPDEEETDVTGVGREKLLALLGADLEGIEHYLYNAEGAIF